MSHQQIFMSFESGEAVEFPLQPLVEILKRYGCRIIAKQHPMSLVEFPLEGDDGRIGSEGSIYTNNDGVLEVAIDGPRYNAEFFSLALEIIAKLNLCMFISSGDEAFVYNEYLIHDLPPSLAEVAKVVQSLGDFGGS